MSADDNDLIGLKSHKPKDPQFLFGNQDPIRDHDLEVLPGLKPEETKATPEPDPKPKTWKYIVLMVFLIGSLWLADVVGFAIPGFLDDIIYDTIIAMIYGAIGYNITFPTRKK